MASPTRAIRSGLTTLLAGITYSKSSGTGNAPYIGSKPVQSYTYFPLIRLNNIILERNDCKDRKGWEAVVSLEIISSTQPGHGSFDPVDEIESTVISRMTNQPYSLMVTGFTINGILFEDSDYDESLRVVDPTNPKAKAQRVITKDVDFVVTVNE